MKIEELLETLEENYIILGNDNLPVTSRHVASRIIIQNIVEFYISTPEIKKKFHESVRENWKKNQIIKREKTGEELLFEYKNSQSGKLNYLIHKKVIPNNLENGFRFIWNEASNFANHQLKGKGNEEMIKPSLIFATEILKWFYNKHNKDAPFILNTKERNTDIKVRNSHELDSKIEIPSKKRKKPIAFLKEVKSRDEINSNQKIKPKPTNSNKWKYATITSLFLVSIFALFYFLKFYNPSIESIEAQPTYEPQKEKIDSTRENINDKSKTSLTLNKSKLNTKRDTLSSDFDSLKKQGLNKKFDNNKYILVNAQVNSDQLDPALLSKILEKYKDQYEFITDKAASSKPTDFEFRTNIKVEYKASQYTEGIISCTISFSYQIINNSDKSIVKNHSSEASGIGHSNNLAKQNAIQKLKI